MEITWLFDTRADAHLMPQHVGTQLGEPESQGTRLGSVGTPCGEKPSRFDQGSVSCGGRERRKTMSSERNAALVSIVHTAHCRHSVPLHRLGTACPTL